MCCSKQRHMAGSWSQAQLLEAPLYVPGEAPEMGAPDALERQLREEPGKLVDASVMLVTMEAS